MPDDELRELAAAGPAARPGRARRPGPADAPRRRRSAGWPPSSPASGCTSTTSTRSTRRASGTSHVRRPARRDVRGVDPVLRRPVPARRLGARRPRRRPHVPQRAAGQALRHPRRHRRRVAAGRRACRSTAAAASSAWRRRWRSSPARRAPARSCAATGSSRCCSARSCRSPPKDVPQLPEDEAATDGLTVRQLVEKHTQRRRRAPSATRGSTRSASRSKASTPSAAAATKDLGGRPIDTRREAAGRHRVRRPRRPARLPADEAARRRSCASSAASCSATPSAAAVQLSDEPLLDEMQRELDDERLPRLGAPSRRSSGAAVPRDPRRRECADGRVAMTVVNRLDTPDPTAMPEADHELTHPPILPPHVPPRPRRDMALPWLESLPVWGDEPPAASVAARPPVRLAVPVLRQRLPQQGVVGQGRRQGRWSWARCSRRSSRLPREDALHPRPVQRRGPQGEHPQLADRQPALRRAARLRRRDPLRHQHRPARSPRRYGRSTKVPSLVLGCETSNPAVHKNYSMLYSSHISWSSPTTPTPLELYPALAFDRLFKDEVEQGRQERARRRARRRQRASASRSARPTSASSTSTSTRSARSSSGSSRPARTGELQGWRPTLDKPEHRRARPTASRRTSPSTCG